MSSLHDTNAVRATGDGGGKMSTILSISCGEPGCDRSFGSESARASHLQYQHQIGIVDPLGYPCRVSTCSASFGTAANRDEHMRDVHRPPGETTQPKEPPAMPDGPTGFTCTERGCDASFDTPSKLGTHRFSKHGIRAKGRVSMKPRVESLVDSLLADEPDEPVTITLREPLAKQLLTIVLEQGDKAIFDMTDPTSLRREADRIELELAIRAAVS